MEENLPELRDIHIPDGVSVWPLAYGWWIILASILGVLLAIYLFMFLQKKSKKVYALRLLHNIHCNNSLNSVVEMSAILRRICVFKYKEATVLMGADWLNFLNAHCKIQLDGNAADLLLNAPYMKAEKNKINSADVVKLKLFCQAWIGENL